EYGGAELDGTEEGPEEARPELGGGDPGAGARLGDGDGHEGLGAVAVVDGAEVGLVGAGQAELGRGGEVGAGGAAVGGDLAEVELLAAGGVEVGQLGDGGDLAEQAGVVVLAAIEAEDFGDPLGLLGPGHVADDVAGEALEGGG